jgi:hypothetical protein
VGLLFGTIGIENPPDAYPLAFVLFAGLGYLPLAMLLRRWCSLPPSDFALLRCARLSARALANLHAVPEYILAYLISALAVMFALFGLRHLARPALG